jgi:tetratricopeptide (TPR) repeat protein
METPLPPPHPRLGTVFVSSVFGGLLARRQQVKAAAGLLGFEALLPEDYTALPRDVASTLALSLAGCDTYVGLFAWRRGTLPKDELAAITEQEFRLARHYGLRRLVFIDQRADAERDPLLEDFLREEAAAYRGGVYPRPYADEQALSLALTSALSALRPRVSLAIGREGAAWHATLYLSGLHPALGEAPDSLGPFPLDLDLSPTATALLQAFLGGAESRARLEEDALKLLGAELWDRLSPAAGELLERCLALAAGAGRLLLLEVRSAEPEALALPWELLHHPAHPLAVKQGLLEVVRHPLAPGNEAGLDPALDLPPTLPRRDFAVLGFTAEPLEDEAPGAGLGDAGLSGPHKLFWEAEQERLLVALDPVLRTGRARLVLPDSGDKAVLAEALSADPRPAILHLSCHGGPVEKDGAIHQAVHLEDAEGYRHPADAAELLGWVRARSGLPPLELVVLSACYTAAHWAPRLGAGLGKQTADAVLPEARTGSLAEDLVRGGLARVLGMQTSVSDRGATAFAGKFYRSLARGQDLGQALHAGRAALREHGAEHEWAIPVLLTTQPLGPLAPPAAEQAASASPLQSARAGFEVDGITYLDEGYVGRHHFERRLYRDWRQGKVRLLAIHGLGGVGKSTLAARFLERRLQEGVPVYTLTGTLAAGDLLERVAERCALARPAELDPQQADAWLREALKARLGGQRTVFLFDNFEDNQDPQSGALRDPALAKALRALAQLAGRGLLLLFTTRKALTLPPGSPAVVNRDLGALSPAEARKLKLLKDGLRPLDQAQWDAVMHYLGGHPKALGLLAAWLADNPDRLASLLGHFQEALGYVDAALAAEDQEHGRALLLDTVLADVPDERLPALDRLALLVEPLPSDELVRLLAADGLADANADIAWLRRQGLLARTVSSSALAGGDAVHRLVATRRLGALAEREGAEAEAHFHRLAAEHYAGRQGPLSDYALAAFHLAAAGDRAGALEMYQRWALALRDGHAYRACEQVAHGGLRHLPLDHTEACRVAAANLYMGVHDALVPLGELHEADAALDQAQALLAGLASKAVDFARAALSLNRAERLANTGQVQPAADAYEAARAGFAGAGAERETAIALGGAARLKAQAGDVQGALDLHQEEMAVYEQLGDVRSRAVTLGDIARLKAQAGDVQGAMALFEEKRQVAEQLGDVRSRAVTLGDIARLKAQAGDVQGARALHDERLETYRHLGDVGSIANALYDLAQLDLTEQAYQEALERLAEAWPLILRLGEVQGIAHVGTLLGQLLAMAEQREAALEVLSRAREAWAVLGQDGNAEQVKQLIGQIRGGPD